MDRSINRKPGSPGIVSRLLILGVRMYQAVLGPLMGGHCRFSPTCSVYSIEALQTHGAIKGMWLTVRRIIRCHPWGGSGYDPVPDSGKESNVVTDNSNND